MQGPIPTVRSVARGHDEGNVMFPFRGTLDGTMAGRSPARSELSPREAEVLLRAAWGEGNRETARALRLSNVHEKLGSTPAARRRGRHYLFCE